jgi:peroxiredoxin
VTPQRPNGAASTTAMKPSATSQATHAPRTQSASRRPYTFAVFITVLFFAVGVAAKTEQANTVAPPFTLKSLDGKTLSLSQYRGKFVLVNFWATWCGPCKDEMPSLEILHQKFQKKNFKILAVSQDMFGAQVVRPYAETNHLTFTILLDQNLEAHQKYRVVNLPTTFLIAPDGKIIGVHQGAEDWARPEFLRFFEDLLQSKT